MIQIFWKGRAGQGILTAADLLGSISIEKGLYSKSFPSFGGERIGAPVDTYNYLDLQPLHLHTMVKKGEIVLIIDPFFVSAGVNIVSNLKDDGILVINVSDLMSDKDVLEKINSGACAIGDGMCSYSLKERNISLYRIDALSIIKDRMKLLTTKSGGVGQNMVILGGFIKIFTKENLEKVKVSMDLMFDLSPSDIRKKLSEMFKNKKNSNKLVDVNIDLVESGYKNLRKVEL